jgi:hypothetical protein
VRDEEVFELARKAVDEKQHARAEHLLCDGRSDKAVFLRIYCRYIVCLSQPRAARFIQLEGSDQRKEGIARLACT